MISLSKKDLCEKAGLRPESLAPIFEPPARQIAAAMTIAALSLASALAPLSASAEPMLIDGIVAQVGDELVLESEVDEQLAILAMRADLPDTSLARAREEILKRIIDEKVIVQEARARGIVISDEEVEQAVENHVDMIREQMGGDDVFQRELKRENLTEAELLDRYRDEARRDLLYTRLIQREIYSQIEVSDADVETYYEEHKEEIPAKPATVELAHVFFGLRPEQAELDRAQAKLDRIHSRLETGEAFSAVALEMSEDPGIRRSPGGEPLPGATADLGWFEPGDLDPRFEAVIAALSPGEISEPFQVPRGVEILRLVERDGDRVRLEHIQVTIEIGADAEERAREKAEMVHGLLEEGADFAAVVDQYSDDRDSAPRAGYLGSFSAGELNPEIERAIRDLEPGELSQVVASEQGFHIFKLISREGGGEYPFEEIADRLRSRIADERAAELTEDWLAEVRASYFIQRADRERPVGQGTEGAQRGRVHFDVNAGSAEKE